MRAIRYSGQFKQDVKLMAAATVFTVPIVVAFFFVRKTFIQGIKLTGLKE